MVKEAHKVEAVVQEEVSHWTISLLVAIVLSLQMEVRAKAQAEVEEYGYGITTGDFKNTTLL